MQLQDASYGSHAVCRWSFCLEKATRVFEVSTIVVKKITAGSYRVNKP